MAKGRLWERNELLPALALYYQIPFGSIDARNPAIQALAASLGRTVGSVALKLANFASLDPSIIESGRTGMQNASKLDRSVFAEFERNWEILSAALPDEVTDTLRTVASQDDTFEETPPVFRDGPTEHILETVQRRGQDFFRNAVLAAYSEKCCVTGIGEPSLLRAGHIIPWNHSEETRLDPRNGLCLNALHDAAFDRGLMTLDEDLRVIFSSNLQSEMPTDTFSKFFQSYEGVRIARPERLAPSVEAITFHRETIFSSS